jgi:hypothetical protein
MGVADDESVGERGEGGIVQLSKSARQERGKEDESESRMQAARAMVWAGKYALVRYRVMMRIDGREGEADWGIRLAR